MVSEELEEPVLLELEDRTVPELFEVELPEFDDLTVPELDELELPELDDLTVPELDELLELPELDDLTDPELDERDEFDPDDRTLPELDDFEPLDPEDRTVPDDLLPLDPEERTDPELPLDLVGGVDLTVPDDDRDDPEFVPTVPLLLLVPVDPGTDFTELGLAEERDTPVSDGSNRRVVFRVPVEVSFDLSTPLVRRP